MTTKRKQIFKVSCNQENRRGGPIHMQGRGNSIFYLLMLSVLLIVLQLCTRLSCKANMIKSCKSDHSMQKTELPWC